MFVTEEAFVVFKYMNYPVRASIGHGSELIGLQSRLAIVREFQVDNRHHTAAKAETTDYSRAFHRAFDSKPRDRSRSAA
jgi:hypothetical protein